MNNILNLELTQGSTFERILTIKDENGNPIDLTGHSFKSQARYSYDSETPAFEFAFSFLDQTSNKGQFKWKLDYTALNSLPASSLKTAFLYDVKWIQPGNIVEELMRGNITVIPRVTK